MDIIRNEDEIFIVMDWRCATKSKNESRILGEVIGG